MGKYWDITKILPYQRNFNFINGSRSIGKTYTAQKYFLSKCIENGCEFVYLVRTQDEKKSGILREAFKKVIDNEFKGVEFKFTEDCLEYKNETGEMCPLGWCIALSESLKVKKRSFPFVKYLMFDEYMIEEKQGMRYVNGWKEPELFLSIYHTIDREEDRVIAFLLGNNTSFYNPYHMHPAFNIPNVKKGEIWTSENVLFQWAVRSEVLNEEKKDSRFLRMIEPTSYGSYAIQGDYAEDSANFIMPRTPAARYMFTFEYMGFTFGVWSDIKKGVIFIDNKVDPSCKVVLALTTDDHKENTMLTSGGRQNNFLYWLGGNFKRGNVRFVNMQVKKLGEQAIRLIL